MHGLTPRGLGSSQVKDWLTPSVPIPSRPRYPAWTWEDPLSSMSNLVGGNGTWSIVDGVLTHQPSGGLFFGLNRHVNAVDSSKDVHVIQVEMMLSANWMQGTEQYGGIGFGSGNTGMPHSVLRYHSSGPQTNFCMVLDNVDIPYYAPTPPNPALGAWHTIRMTWDVPAATMSGLLNGTLAWSGARSQSESGIYPEFNSYRNGGTAPTYSFRNLKYWGGFAGEIQP